MRPLARALDRLRGALHVVVREMVKFGAVGAAAYVVDVAVFNALRLGTGDGGPLADRPLTAKALSVAVATAVAWLGNRYWTFRRRRRAGVGRELVLFVVMNVGGMLIALLCLGVSHYLLGLTSALADNVSANVVGLVLGTAFRFWAYRTLVFRDQPPTPLDAAAAAAVVSDPATAAGGARRRRARPRRGRR